LRTSSIQPFGRVYYPQMEKRPMNAVTTK